MSVWLWTTRKKVIVFLVVCACLFAFGFFVGRRSGAEQISRGRELADGMQGRIDALEVDIDCLEEEIERVRGTNLELARELGASARQVDAIRGAIGGIGSDADAVAGGLDGLIDKISRFERIYAEIGDIVETDEAFYMAR